MCEEKTESECDRCKKCGCAPIINKFYFTIQTAKGARFTKHISDVKESDLEKAVEVLKLPDDKEINLQPPTKLTLKICGLVVGFALFMDGIFEALKVLFH